MKLSKRSYAAVRRYPAVAGLIVFSFGAIIYFSLVRGTAPRQNILAVTRGTITEAVIVTGKTKPVYSVNLSFERSGTVTRVRAAVGDAVLPGQIILELGNGELQTDLAEAEANVEGQQAKLDELKRGVRPEEIQIKETERDKANQDLANLYDNVPDVLNDGYTKADDAVRNQMDSFFTNDETSNPQLSFSTANSQVQRDTEAGRVSASRELNIWKSGLGDIAQSSSSVLLVAQSLDGGETHLSKIQAFLDMATDALNGAAGLLSPSAFTSYKTSLTNARNAVHAARTSVTGQQQSIASYKIAVKKLDDELRFDRAGSTTEAIAAQDAQVKQARAQKERVEVNLAKTILRSPIAGILTVQDGKVGETVAANFPIASVISENKLEIEASVPEVDIGKIALRNPVKIAIDAFPNETFSGTVASIDPAETIVDGVVNFKIKITFDNPDPRVKSGLTANLTIETKTKTDALILPQFAILETDAGSFVKKVNGETAREIPVIIGIRSQDGRVQILSGLAEGDAVLNIGAKTE